MSESQRIISARISPLPRHYFDPMPSVYVVTEDGVEHELFSYYPDEISFDSGEFIGLSLEQARHLKFERDRAYLVD